ncbi:hypothetical protein F5B19DRAFT_138308 [Rostrohypoxylon terebratum]|nr:hypothetical protein F5B19DRAFT_138308 [Rostrohypoxylon terebratum]
MTTLAAFILANHIDSLMCIVVCADVPSLRDSLKYLWRIQVFVVQLTQLLRPLRPKNNLIVRRLHYNLRAANL